MKYIIEILKGMLIGVSSIIPGLSGGTIAVSMGIYEDLIYTVNNVLKTPIKCLKKMWTYIIGMAVGLVLGIFAIVALFNIAPVPTTMFFVGLVLGAIPEITKKIEPKPFRLRDLICFNIFVAITIFLPLIISEPVQTIKGGAIENIYLIILGLLSAAAVVIPGVSGSMLLMAVGYYTVIVTTVSICLKQVLTFKIIEAIMTGKILIPYAIGMIVGIFLMAKLIEILIKKDEANVYWGILGLIIASPFPVILGLDLVNISAFSAIISAVLLILGIYITLFLSKLSKN